MWGFSQNSMADDDDVKFTASYWVDSPHRFSWGSLAHVVRRTVNAVLEVETSIRCAGVAFFSFLSMFPAVAALVAVYTLFTDPSIINDQLLLAAAVLPGDVVDLLHTQLDTLIGRDWDLGVSLVVSLLLTLWTGSRGVNALLHAITRAHLEADERSFIQSTALSIIFTIAALILVGVMTTAVALVPIAISFFPVEDSRGTLTLWLRWPVVALIVFAAFLVLFTKAPYRRDPRTRWVAPGALISTLLWIAGSIGFSFYIENFANYNATFGSIAATAVLMLWLYFSAFVVVLGAILNAQLEYQTGMDTTVGPPAPRGQRGAYVADHIARVDAWRLKQAKKPDPIDVVPMRPNQPGNYDD